MHGPSPPGYIMGLLAVHGGIFCLTYMNGLNLMVHVRRIMGVNIPVPWSIWI